MTAALVRRSAQEVARIEYSDEQRQLIKDVYAKGASDAEFRMFVEVSKYQGLDIFKKQIYLMKFWDVDKGDWGFQPVTGIDGYRSKAEDTGLYGGQLGPFWCGEDGVWKDVWTSKNPPAAAKVGIIRTDWKEPCWAVARYVSYVQTKKDGTPNKMWAKMPDNQLAKCAEALGLRKAFPQQVGGLYTDVEMEQAANEPIRNTEPTAANIKREYPDIKAVAPVVEIDHAREALKEELRALWPKTKPAEEFEPYFNKKFGKVPTANLKVQVEEAKRKAAEFAKAATEKVEPEAAGQVIDAEVTEEDEHTLDVLDAIHAEIAKCQSLGVADEDIQSIIGPLPLEQQDSGALATVLITLQSVADTAKRNAKK